MRAVAEEEADQARARPIECDNSKVPPVQSAQRPRPTARSAALWLGAAQGANLGASQRLRKPESPLPRPKSQVEAPGYVEGTLPKPCVGGSNPLGG